MTDLDRVKEAVNRTRIELREAERCRIRDEDSITIHDAFAIFAAKLDEVFHE